MDKIIIIQAFADNYIYIYQYNQNSAIAIDPGDSSAVLKALEKHGLKLTAILATHHHYDHIGGIAKLKSKTSCQIIGSDRRITGSDCLVEDGQILTFGNTSIEVISTPGHTRTSVCYYITEDNNCPSVFTGDTLFIGGCGRLFECDAKTMWNSLRKLASLPDNTKVYCGHDYTLENYQFALEVEPENPALKQRLSEIQQVIQQGKQTVPSTIAQEKTTNVFLSAKTVEEFAGLRQRKDNF